MSDPFLPDAGTLDDCGCCEGTSDRTPAEVTNAPAQSAVQRRVGRYGEFVESLEAALGREITPKENPSVAPLRALTTRSTDDFTIALLDAWAGASDVLTFYQERISNETYRRTATERRSLYELARLIGYRPTPGVVASVDLAFTLDDFPSVPPIHTELPEGLKVQSVPLGDEKPQLYETTETIPARSEWNSLRIRMDQPQELNASSDLVILSGDSVNVQPGDTVLLVFADGGTAIRDVVRVSVDTDRHETTLSFVTFPVVPPAFNRPELDDGSVEQISATELDDSVISEIMDETWRIEDLSALGTLKGWDEQALEKALNNAINIARAASGTSVFVFRQRAAIFGYNAPLYSSLPANLRYTTQVEVKKSDGTYGKVDIPAAYPVDWDSAPARKLESDASGTIAGRFVHLDNLYPAITPGSWIVLTAGTSAGTVSELALRVNAALEMTRTAYSISGKISRLLVDQEANFPDAFEIRTTAVLGQSEPLTPAPAPIIDDIAGSEVSLGRTYLGLGAGQLVDLSGERSDLLGVFGHELRTLSAVLAVGGYTVLQFDVPLDYSYLRNTVRINANVAHGTHGETRSEILGSGDGSKPFQRFALRQPPLTYISSSSATGVESTLRVYVDEVLWTEVPYLFGHGPNERIYSTWTDDENVTTVQFGDGLTGARLTTGQDNVRAVYRRGIGTVGLVKTGQLTAAMTRPLGMREVTNPLPSEGAADPEGLDEARDNLPLQVMTLDRVVSLVDYEDFCRAFAGVRKALAIETWDGERRGIFITVAGAGGAAINPGSDVYDNLADALRKYGDPHVPITLETYRPALFRIDATVTYDPSYVPDRVKPAIEAALRAAFDFDARSFGQPVALSEVISVIQRVEGVVAVDVNELFRTDADPKKHPEPRLSAALPDGALAAELLTLDPAPITLR
jgi:predicted phage baseplate assembly protein